MSADLPARSLLDRPQRLGFLPTLWFWNDGARQRELLPIVVPIVVVVVFVTDRLALRSPALDALGFAIVLLHPFLVMGLVERHIRRQLRQRPAAERLAAAIEPPPPRPLGPLVPVGLAGAAAVLLTLAMLGLGPALAVLALAAGLGAAMHRRERRLLALADAEAGRREP